MSIFFPLTCHPLKENPLMALVMQPNNPCANEQTKTCLFFLYFIPCIVFKNTRTNQLAEWKHSMTNVPQRPFWSNALQLLKAFKMFFHVCNQYDAFSFSSAHKYFSDSSIHSPAWSLWILIGPALNINLGWGQHDEVQTGTAVDPAITRAVSRVHKQTNGCACRSGDYEHPEPIQEGTQKQFWKVLFRVWNQRISSDSEATNKKEKSRD